MSSHAVVHTPVGGELMTPFFRKLLFFVALGAAAVLWRFAFGIGAVSNLNDGYPWGIWIAFDVVTGTALGCGGYAVALLVYVLNKGEYHPLVRPAVLTSLLGYGLAVLAVTIDLGRYWDLWKVPVFFWRWSGSPQLEVALCVAAYVTVLLVELSPAAFEKWKDGAHAGLRKVSEAGLRVMDKALVWILALGMLLPTMHQSSLGTMMLLAGPRLHPLWFTPWLPFLFLVNCIVMGYAVVVLEASWSAREFGRPREDAMLAKLSKVAFFVAAFWLAFRALEVVVAGDLGQLLSPIGVVFLIELALAALPVWWLSNDARRADAAYQVRSALMLVLAGTVYRINTYWIAFNPGPQWSYFPAVPELLITFGIVALEIALYLWAVRTFPILAGGEAGAVARG
ncbi:MAG: Ni/Fe-hydrogenase cytochrome b subunit [Vicinamibacteria bacterium]|nr:Ni/Fe-hydrogenase cytochrome b subunit [Vicinamibacteria bacterium]